MKPLNNNADRRSPPRSAPDTLGLANKLQILVVSRFHDVFFPSLAEAFPLVVAALAPPPSLVQRLFLVAHHETVKAVLVVLVLNGNKAGRRLQKHASLCVQNARK